VRLVDRGHFLDGVITGRAANLGHVVSIGQALLVVTYLSDVWIIGDLYEQDFQAVQVGSGAAITTSAYPGLTLGGRVTYIGETGNLVTLKREEWNGLVDLIKSGELKKVCFAVNRCAIVAAIASETRIGSTS
jgi:hypothetical protein